MDINEAKIKLLAQAIYELRILLSRYVGPSDGVATPEVASANLVYALHNEALAIIENRPSDFDIDKAIENIKRFEEITGGKYSDELHRMLTEIKT